MKNVISARDIEEMIRKGGDVQILPADAILTPSARDLLRDLENGGATAKPAARVNGRAGRQAAAARQAAQLASRPRPSSRRSSIRAYCHGLKEQICDMGRRLWQRAYVDGNGGNIAIRVGEDIALCTPTLVSKGFMKPEDMCLVDFEGNQLARHEEAHQRNPDAPADDEAAAQGRRHLPLPSALRHRLRGRRRRAAHLHDAGV